MSSESTLLFVRSQNSTAPQPQNDPPDEQTGQFGDSSDPGLESDEDLDGEHDADGGPALHHPG